MQSFVSKLDSTGLCKPRGSAKSVLGFMLSHGPFLTCGSQYPVCSSNIWNLYNRTLAVEGIHVLAKQVSFILFLWL